MESAWFAVDANEQWFACSPELSLEQLVASFPGVTVAPHSPPPEHTPLCLLLGSWDTPSFAPFVPLLQRPITWAWSSDAKAKLLEALDAHPIKTMHQQEQWMHQHLPPLSISVALEGLRTSLRQLAASNPLLLGCVHMQQGAYEKAVPLFRQVLERGLAKQEQTWQVSLWLGATYSYLGENALAETLLYQTMKDAEGWTKLQAMTEWGLFLQTRGDYTEAEAVHRACLALPETDTLVCSTNLAITLLSLGKLDEAEPILQNNLLIRQQRGHWTEAHVCKFYLGMLAFSRTHYEVALNHLWEVYRFRQRVLSPDHPSLLNTMSALAFVEDAQQHFQEAHDWYEQCVDVSRRLRGKTHPLTLRFIFNWALVCEREPTHRWWTKAEQLYQHCFLARREVLGENDPDTTEALLGWVEMMVERRRKPIEILPWIRKVVEMPHRDHNDLEHAKQLLVWVESQII